MDSAAALMMKVRAGDTSAFEGLVRLYQNSIFSFAFRFLGDEHRACDITQEIFLRVYQARLTYRPSAKFSTWIFRIARNLCLNELRARHSAPVAAGSSGDSAEPGDPIRGVLQPTAPSSDDPSATAEKLEVAKSVKDAVDLLPTNQRTAVILARYEKLSYEEIAEVMETSVKAVKSLLSRAKENLRQSLRDIFANE